MVCSIKTSFIFLFDKRAQNDPVWGRLLKRPFFSSFWKTGSYMSVSIRFSWYYYCTTCGSAPSTVPSYKSSAPPLTTPPSPPPTSSHAPPARIRSRSCHRRSRKRFLSIARRSIRYSEGWRRGRTWTGRWRYVRCAASRKLILCRCRSEAPTNPCLCSISALNVLISGTINNWWHPSR